MIVASKSISKFSQLPSPGTPQIMLMYHLQPDSPHVFVERDLDGLYMPYYDIVNLVTLPKTNMKDDMPCCYVTITTTAVRILHQDYNHS